jgi:hypothetical protein
MAHFLGIGTSDRRYACAAPSSNNAARTWFCESSAEARIKGEAHSLCAPHDARKAACAKPAFVAHLARSVTGIDPSGDGTDGPAGGGSGTDESTDARAWHPAADSSAASASRRASRCGGPSDDHRRVVVDIASA